MAQVEEALSEHVFVDEVDLILVDWDLGNNVHGEDAIDRIRQIVQYKDVVFYSGEATVMQLRQKVFDKNLEGVYCASRPELVDEVVGVFDSLIKKVLDLDHTRGIVMGATSDIDHMINTCLTLAHSKLDEAGKAKFIENALERVEDQVRNLAKIGDGLKVGPTLDALFKAHMLFTADQRLRLLASVLSMAELAAFSEGKKVVEAYRSGVLKNRNSLGHAVLVPKGRPNQVLDDAGNVVDIDQMRKLRILILGLRAEFRGLLDSLQA